MVVPTIIMGILAAILFVLGYRMGEGQHISGLHAALTMTIEVLPLLVFAFIVAGMIQVLLPKELLAKWVGDQSGFRGILIGSVAGGFCPGGPFVSLPIAAGIFRSGASLGTMVAFLTAWSLWAAGRIPMEVAILGWKLTLIRLASTFVFPPIAGLIAQTFFTGAR
ncbi:MAG: permease [bacterium]